MWRAVHGETASSVLHAFGRASYFQLTRSDTYAMTSDCHQISGMPSWCKKLNMSYLKFVNQFPQGLLLNGGLFTWRYECLRRWFS